MNVLILIHITALRSVGTLLDLTSVCVPGATSLGKMVSAVKMLMSVSEALTTVVTSASTQLEATTAPVLMDIDCLGMDCPVKISTNVLIQVHTAALRSVRTLLDLTCVCASRATSFREMVSVVKMLMNVQ
jgi:hypothetical protein